MADASIHMKDTSPHSESSEENTKRNEDTQTVKEGKAEIFQPISVFYNPVQEFNRDLTVCVITQHIKLLRDEASQKKNATTTGKKQQEMNTEKHTENLEEVGQYMDIESTFIEPDEKELVPGTKYENGISILEALAASGLRSIRFALEIPGVKTILTNDCDKGAVEFIKRNTVHNKVEHLVTASLADATILMYQHKKVSERFDVIDLDPYGSAAPFLDSAVQAVKDGGLMCITCTDLAILCGNAPEACFAKYGAMSLKIKSCHEMALRILLQCIESHANRYSRYIEPLLSVSADFYIRVFVRIHSGQNIVKRSVTKKSMVYMCTGCGSFVFQPLANQISTKGNNFKFVPAHGPPVGDKCEQCEGRFVIGGPIWTAPIHNTDFVKKVLLHVKDHSSSFKTAQRIQGVLNVILEELPDIPLYYVTDDLVSTIHCTPPNLMQIRSAILHAGYKVTHSHAAKNSLKTTAPMSVLWDILRCWVKEHPVNPKRLALPTTGARILSKPSCIEADFSPHPEANPKSRQEGLLRWQINPEKDWGPKPKGSRTETVETRRQKGLAKKDGKRKSEVVDLRSFPCKKYRVGKCELGDSCKYSHSIEACK